MQASPIRTHPFCWKIAVFTRADIPPCREVGRGPRSPRSRGIVNRKATLEASVAAICNSLPHRNVLRYLAGLAAVNQPKPSLAAEAAAICRRRRQNGRSYRALNPLNAGDAALLEPIARGEWNLRGFRNRDLRERRTISITACQKGGDA